MLAHCYFQLTVQQCNLNKKERFQSLKTCLRCHYANTGYLGVRLLTVAFQSVPKLAHPPLTRLRLDIKRKIIGSCLKDSTCHTECDIWIGHLGSGSRRINGRTMRLDGPQAPAGPQLELVFSF
ncbi:hypothetical protein GOODEAATRI_002457 [Goodea atripinnis]|uniref:Uncharacterized protein n=1 Tax=Goodea atripinnis TaxID=208336 RepID=A0ABV0PAV8_9TELE